MRRCDQPPFGPDGGSSSASEAIDAAVELRVGEDGLDDCLALAVELAAAFCGEDTAHERVGAAVPAGAGALAALGVSELARVDMTRNGTTDPDEAEWLLPVRWIHDVARDQAIKDSDLFANQNSAVRLTHGYTLKRLRDAFADSGS
ncbi:MAG: hypothetical protein QOD24_227 [Solirubrobacteraceae bacterium]|nr:hypothetical protein [Solirubrobacteraceae bacterium]